MPPIIASARSLPCQFWKCCGGGGRCGHDSARPRRLHALQERIQLSTVKTWLLSLYCERSNCMMGESGSAPIELMRTSGQLLFITGRMTS